LAKHKKKRSSAAPIYSFALCWLGLSFLLPLHELWGILVCFLLSSLVSGLTALIGGARRKRKERKEQAELEKQQASPTGLGEDVDAIYLEGRRALSEMAKLYSSIREPEVRQKINELMRITDKIMQNAAADPSDVPQTKKFMNYYLPTTIKLLHSYDRMSAQGIEGENLDKSMKNINEMLDAAIVAYKKRLDSLFANQALDIETDIEVMNTMLAREGLAGVSDFDVSAQEDKLKREQQTTGQGMLQQMPQ